MLLQNDYAMSVCNRRGTPSVHTLWQEGVPIRACPEIKSKKKWCSISLVIASLVVFFVVLAIAGIALYIGTLHTEPSSNTGKNKLFFCLINNITFFPRFSLISL